MGLFFVIVAITQMFPRVANIPKERNFAKENDNVNKKISYCFTEIDFIFTVFIQPQPQRLFWKSEGCIVRSRSAPMNSFILSNVVR